MVESDINPNPVARALVYGAHRVNLMKGVWLVLKAAYKHWLAWFYPPRSASADNAQWLCMQSKMLKGWTPWMATEVREPGSWTPSRYGEIPPPSAYPADCSKGKALIEGKIRAIFEDVLPSYLDKAFRSEEQTDTKTAEGCRIAQRLWRDVFGAHLSGQSGPCPSHHPWS